MIKLESLAQDQIWDPLAALIASVMRSHQVCASVAYCLIAERFERDHFERLKNV
jgi:hypothetical protein